MSNGSWIDDLLEALCRIYKLWGGDCSDFDSDPHKAVELVIGAYQKFGVPIFPNPQSKDECLKDLDSLEDLLAMPENSLSPADNAALTTFIADMRKDIG